MEPQCPMCGSLMGAEARPAAMRSAAEIQDQIDRLAYRLRELEGGSWEFAGAVVCTPCQTVMVGVTSDRTADVAARLQERIRQLEHKLAELQRRIA